MESNLRRLAFTLTLFVPVVAFAQAPQATSEQDVINSYVKALESQLVFKNQQATFYEQRIKDWVEYAKPLYETPQKTGENTK